MEGEEEGGYVCLSVCICLSVCLYISLQVFSAMSHGLRFDHT